MTIKVKWNQLEYIIGISVSFIAFIVYCFTLCPTVNFIDSGELAAVAYTLGIAHPTGYPLFTTIGHIFVHLPLGLRSIQQLNLLSAVFCSLSLFFFFKFLIFLLKNIFLTSVNPTNSPINIIDKRSLIRIYIPAIFGTLVFAFSETFWSQAVSIEVYSLHILLLTIILYLFIKASYFRFAQEHIVNDLKLRWSYWIGFAFVLGLSFTNHMTTILIAPALLYLYFYYHGFNYITWKNIALLSIPFLLGFSMYLYLPIRASQHPIMNWGNPVDFEKWYWHFSGKVYRVWIFSSTESAAKQFNYFFSTLPDEFAYFPLGFSCIGILTLFKRQKQLLIFTVLLFCICVLYSINYDIHDIDSYFLLAYLTIAIWAGIGTSQLIEWFKQKNIFYIIVAMSVLTIALLMYNYKRIDESNHYLVEDYTKELLKSIEPNGIVISYQWDYFVSSAYYFQIVEHYRPDVIIIDKELLRRSWYYVQLEDRYLWLFKQIAKDKNDFSIELKKFEHNEPYNPQVIEHYYSKLIRSIIENNYFQRPIYVTPEIEYQYTTGYNRIPVGLVFRLAMDTTTFDMPLIDFNYRLPKRSDIYVDGILSLYARAYYNNTIYLNMIGKKDEAIKYLNTAVELHPELRDPINSYRKGIK